MQNRHDNGVGIEVVVGLFMFTILIALGVFTIVLSRQNFLQKKYPIKILFDDVGGLRVGDYVYTRGTKIGTIKEIELEPECVVVRSDLSSKLEFHKDYRIEIVASSMLGGKSLKINVGSSSVPKISEGKTLRGETPIDMLEELSVAATSLREMANEIAAGKGTLGKLINDEELYKELHASVANLSQISDNLATGKGVMGKLLSDDDTLYNDLQLTVDNLKTVSEKINSGEGTLGKLMADNAMYDDLHAAIANLRDVSEKIERGEGTIGKLIADDTFYNDLQTSVANLSGISDKIGNGEGTLGRLVGDDELYNKIIALLEETSATVDDLRETSPVTTFSSVLMGAF